MNDSFQFSVIIPTHNRSNYLIQAIDSVLKQKNVSVQIIVVDDASADDTPQVVSQLQKSNPCIKYIRNDTSAFAHGSRLIGYKSAVGSYIIFMDDDDFYIDEYFFEKAVKVFEENLTVSVVIGATTIFFNGEYKGAINLNGEGLVDGNDYLNGFQSVYTKPESTLSAVFRKKTLDKLNLVESKMINDTCIYLYGIVHGDIFLINKPVAAYRIHASNISKGRFSSDFIINTLEEKIKIYRIAHRLKLLNNEKEWLFTQLKVSVNYFIRCSKSNPFMILKIVLWVLIYGHGTQKKFLKTYLQYFANIIKS